MFSACVATSPFAVGYVEGEFALLAPVETARVSAVLVRRGDRVEPGEVLIEMERLDAEIAMARAQAGLAGAKSQLADLEHARRPEEIRMAEASLISAQAQLQAMQLTFFFFLPSLLLSSFMFPNRGMPQWVQILGAFFPVTHFLRIVRAVMLKGAGYSAVASSMAVLFLFVIAYAALALTRFRRTLD